MDGSGQIMGTVSLVFKAITSTGNNESGRNSLILWMRLRGRVQEIFGVGGARRTGFGVVMTIPEF